MVSNLQQISNKIKVALILPSEGLPIPAVLGGAIESLVSSLVDKNEENKQLELVIISRYDNSIAKINKEYYNSKLYYYREFIRIPAIIKSKLYGAYVLIKRYVPHFPIVNIGYYRFASNIVLREKADYVVAEGGNYLCFEKLSRILGKEKMVIHIHHHLIGTAQLKKIFGKSISVSSFVKREWIRDDISVDTNNVVLKNCITHTNFRNTISSKELLSLRSELGYSDDDFIILFCGRIIPEKGVKELIQAVLNINNKRLKLLIVGSANFGKSQKQTRYERDVLHLIQKDVTRIKHIGYISSDTLYRYYHLSNALVVPTLCEEAAGLVSIEGQLAKLPIIITKSGGLVEYTPDNGAIIINKGENIVQNLEDAITYVLENDLSERVDKSYEYVVKLNPETYYEEFVSIIMTWYLHNIQEKWRKI